MVEIVPATTSARSDPAGEEADAGVSVEHREDCSAICRWVIPGFSKLKQRTTKCLWSKYFEVGGYDCRLLVYPTGDSQALPGYISIYLQVTDPKNSSGKWDCFASYRLCIANQVDESKGIARDSWHRFSAKRKSHGWCDFVQSSNVLEQGAGFAINDSILVTADILVLSESTQFAKENELASAATNANSEVLSGKFTWKVKNFGLFRDMIKTQKIMSPAFSAGECSLRLSVYQSVVNGTDNLSMCLESKDTDKTGNAERSCWCLFRMSVMSQAQKGRHMHRDSYGRFAADSKTGDNTSLGWNDFMSVSAFTDPESGFLVDNTAIFCASFHIIKESSTFNRSMERGLTLKNQRPKGRPGDTFQGKFTWKIEHFTKLKELLKKRKITGLCIKSRRFQVGSRDCRLIVYPRGQSQPPNHLSMFLEVTDPSTSNPDWSCFVSHRLSVVNHRGDDKSVAKESQNRYSKQAKDWGWREFVTLTSLFDLDAGFLVNDCVMFAAEVLVLRETSELKALPDAKNHYLEYHSAKSAATLETPILRFSWRIENFVAFKEIMETRKIFSKYFSVEGCDLRIGVYESFDTLCIYLESDAFGSGLERNFWVKYRIAILNQKYPDRTDWKESSICTKTWNNSVLQFMKVTEMVDPEAGYVQRDGLLLACEVIDCQPWFDFADLEVFASDSEAESLSTSPEELLDSDDSDGLITEGEDTFRALLGDAGLHLIGHDCAAGLDMGDLQQVLSDKMQLDSTAASTFVAGLRMYFDDDAYKIKRLLMPGHPRDEDPSSGICLFDLLMGIEVLQAPLLDLLLDMLIQLCHQQPKPRAPVPRVRKPVHVSTHESAASPADPHSRFGLEGREDMECASSSTPLAVEPLSASHKAQLPSQAQGSTAAAASPVSPQGEQSQARPVEPPSIHIEEFSGVPNGSPHGESSHVDSRTAWLNGREKAEELMAIALKWLGGVHHFTALSMQSSSQPTLSLIGKVQTLLNDLPRLLQPQLVLLVPKLVHESEHTIAAGLLMNLLAAAGQINTDYEQELRLPVLSALSLLHIRQDTAISVLGTALGSLPALADSELAPAIGLIFKLADETSATCADAVKVVRRRVKKRQEALPGTLEAIRLAVNQHADVAQEMLVEIDADCKNAKSLSEAESREAGGESLASLHPYDIEVLLDLLRSTNLAERARSVFERAIVKGFLTEINMAAVLEQRKIRANHAHAHAFMSVDGSGQIAGLRDNHGAAPLGGRSGAWDDTDTVLSLAEHLAASKHQKARSFAANLYQTIFRVNNEEQKRGRMLRGLIARAAAGSSFPQPQAAKDKNSASLAGSKSSAAPANGRNTSAASRQSRPGSSSGQQAEAQPSRPEMDVTTPEGLLLTLISQYSGAARPAVVLMMLEAQAANNKATAYSKRVVELEAAQEKAAKEQKNSSAKLIKEAEKLTARLTEADSQLAQLRVDYASEQAAHAAIKKDLEERVRNQERELEWVRGEREEEQASMSQERRELASRLSQAEAITNRQKSASKDEVKKAVRERAQLTERCRDLENGNSKLEDELLKLRESNTLQVATCESLNTRLKEQEREAENSIQQRDTELAEARARQQELEKNLKDRQSYAATIESQLREEVARSAPVFGSNLDRLSTVQLEQLIRLHERGLKQSRNLLGQRRSEESAMATALSAVQSVTGGPPPRPLGVFRGNSGGGAAQHVTQPHTPQTSSGLAQRQASLGSVDSIISMSGLDPSLGHPLRNLAPGDRAPGSAQSTPARSLDRSLGQFGNVGMHRSAGPGGQGGQSYFQAGNQHAHQNGNPRNNSAFSNSDLPNGLLSGTGLLNSHNHQPSGNGVHRMW